MHVLFICTHVNLLCGGLFCPWLEKCYANTRRHMIRLPLLRSCSDINRKLSHFGTKASNGKVYICSLKFCTLLHCWNKYKPELTNSIVSQTADLAIDRFGLFMVAFYQLHLRDDTCSSWLYICRCIAVVHMDYLVMNISSYIFPCQTVISSVPPMLWKLTLIRKRGFFPAVHPSQPSLKY